jgi:hypothetical protein
LNCRYLREKQTKNRKNCTFTVCRHTTKGGESPLPCANTRQRGHVALTCRPRSGLGRPNGHCAVSRGHTVNRKTRQRLGPAMVLVQPAVKGRHTVVLAHGRCSAVSNRAHGREGPHPGEQQTSKSLYSAMHDLKHTADTLPCHAGTGTRQTSSAVSVTAVTSLPCACTRQMVCRVQKQVCRVNGPHGRGVDSGSDIHLPMSMTTCSASTSTPQVLAVRCVPSMVLMA